MCFLENFAQKKKRPKAFPLETSPPKKKRPRAFLMKLREGHNWANHPLADAPKRQWRAPIIWTGGREGSGGVCAEDPGGGGEGGEVPEVRCGTLGQSAPRRNPGIRDAMGTRGWGAVLAVIPQANVLLGPKTHWHRPVLFKFCGTPNLMQKPGFRLRWLVQSNSAS